MFGQLTQPIQGCKLYQDKICFSSITNFFVLKNQRPSHFVPLIDEHCKDTFYFSRTSTAAWVESSCTVVYKVDKEQSIGCQYRDKSGQEHCPILMAVVFLLLFLTKSWKVHFLVQASFRPNKPSRGAGRTLKRAWVESGGSGDGRSVKRSATSYRRSKNNLGIRSQCCKEQKYLITYKNQQFSG